MTSPKARADAGFNKMHSVEADFKANKIKHLEFSYSPEILFLKIIFFFSWAQIL
ncbi:hypothetical protein QN362_11205 [Actimicrobium sp. CCC2.4]|uniref:hypothetical protein n=1 Tax=Actimicrobium sp. CCC2.4 TaxID=3048606 RepID=UPI002AC8DB3B|nr:hypothetical protein [Actimicrobium sp. CCC2.4]MEB0135895.1 hypothetical protein [Actimicrobium sp. CCC2.4]WPX32562.1 hypothetical protein RHM62_01565 [Actimicrobium sp. CCC2.4]